MTARLDLDPKQVERTLERASMLPPTAFSDPAVLERELSSVFGREWICAAHVSAVAEPGAFVMRELGDQSFFVIGGKDGRPRAFHNVCRHRGARILDRHRGRVRARITCPYHAWLYGFDGELLGARATEGLEDFDPGRYGLVPLRAEDVGGLVLVDLGGAAEPAGEIYIQTGYDPSPAPEGTQLLSVFGQYAPYEVNGGWEARREEVARQFIDLIDRFAPGFEDTLIEYEVLSPANIESRIGLTGGNIFQGEVTPDQMWEGRLAARTPIDGLYLCGAATHPAGSVIALNGRNAAAAVLADQGAALAVA